MATWKTTDFSGQKFSVSLLPIVPRLQMHPSILCSVILGLGLCKVFPTVPYQRAFYLILPVGGTSGRLEGERREGTSFPLVFMPP